MARSTMVATIAFVRDLISDPAFDATGSPITPYFSDDQVQNVCDEVFLAYTQIAISARPVIDSAGTTHYYTFTAGKTSGYWEAGALLQDATYATITPSAPPDYERGIWTFAASPAVPVYFSGTWYDTYAIAARLLRRWAAKLKLKFTVQIDYQQFRREQPFTHMLLLAAEYEKLAQCVVGRNVRSDVRPINNRVPNGFGPTSRSAFRSF